MSSRAAGRFYTAGLWLKQFPGWRRRQRPDSVRNILVLHHLLLGDSLMAMALVSALRQQYPEAQIVLALPKAFVCLFDSHPWGVRAIGWDPRDLGSLQALNHLPTADLCYLPADNRYSWLARGLGARWIIGFANDRPAYKNWMLDAAIPYSVAPSAWSDTVAELAGAPAPRPYRRSDWPSPVAEKLPLAALNHSTPYVVLHVGASSVLKQWPAERWHTLAKRLEQAGLQPVWSAGVQETALVQACDPEQRWSSTAGLLSLNQLWRLIENARLLVSPDTGVAHLGRITMTPTLCLFGPGSALLCGAGRFWSHSPYQALSQPIACRDQTSNFQRQIPWIRRCERFIGHAPGQCPEARCMQHLEVDQVIQAALTLLQEASTT